ncbi:unnamed protein product [Moneuplotes crassus]|uniref:Uncharacterized protein n=1 Tax=Euplotes crassus TaxID=5936 RepID=A0AAD1UN39_EUPCR|nr:unnamed protein product [Moneuplotes crassus]
MNLNRAFSSCRQNIIHCNHSFFRSYFCCPFRNIFLTRFESNDVRFLISETQLVCQNFLCLQFFNEDFCCCKPPLFERRILASGRYLLSYSSSAMCTSCMNIWFSDFLFLSETHKSFLIVKWFPNDSINCPISLFLMLPLSFISKLVCHFLVGLTRFNTAGDSFGTSQRS